MNSMTAYYLSRVLISGVMGVFLLVGGLPWWAALPAAALVLALFVWMPRGGRFVVKPEGGATALRRDERGQRISDRAATIAFAGLMVATGTLAIYARIILAATVPAGWLGLLVAFGATSYFVADVWLRRKG